MSALLRLAVGEDAELSSEASETWAVLVQGNAEVKGVVEEVGKQLAVQL